MNKIYIVVFLLFLTNICYSQTDNFYFYKGKKVNIDINKELIYVELKNNVNVKNLLSEDKIPIEEFKNGKLKNKFWKLIKISTDKKLKQYESIKNKLRKDQNIISISSVIGKKIPISISGPFYIKLKTNNDYTLLEEIARRNSCQILRQVKYMPKWYALSTPKNAESLNMANIFFETGYFEEIDPGFDLNFSTKCIDDPDFDQQWGLSNANGIDIDACEAWEVTRGSSNITVAVLDLGIDLDHDEFADNLLANSFDAFTNSSPADEYDDHGTHVAGIIGANQNNNQVSGVAPLTSLMSISHPLQSGNDLISEQLATGMSWAWQNGADIINNSWGDQGGAFYNDLQSALLESAIDDALSSGRNGLGCILVYASGNHSPAIDYPGSYTSDIICVGSIDQTGTRASSSGYGNELDLVAPGVDILSTIRNNGTDTFSGTSMAAPHVAGVAALVLSINPNLTQDEVRNIIESTCTKVGNYNYTSTSERFNGTWDDEVGYGLVNAHQAVLSGLAALPIITGSNLVCTSGSQYSLNNLPPNTTVSWSSSSNISFPSGNTGSSVSAQASSSTTSGSGWLEATLTTSSGSFTLPRKDVWVGTPASSLRGNTDLQKGAPGIVFIDYVGNYSLQDRPQASWSYFGPLDYLTGDNGKAKYRANRRRGGPGSIYLDLNNQCGSSNESLDFYVEGDETFMRIYPNPANAYAEINFYNKNEISEYQKSSPTVVSIPLNNQTQELGEYEIQIWHERKGLVRKIKSRDKKLQIKTNSLDEGLYFLHVIINGQVYKQKLKIER